MSDWGKGVINNAIEWGKGAINNAIGWGIYYLDSWAGDTEIYGDSNDVDAQAFINAAGISGSTQTSAINQLVLDLKGEGSTTNNSDLWTAKLHAVYPFCPIDGTTATLDGFKWNLRDPRDLDAAYRLTFFNSPTAAQTGVKGNGTTQYANSFFVLSSNGDKDNFGLTLSTPTSTELAGVDVDFGANDGSITNLAIRNADTASFRAANSNNTLANTNAAGVWTGSQIVASNVIYKNGVSFASATSSTGTATAIALFLMARNNSGTAGFFTDRIYDFAAIHTGLTANEAKDLFDAIDKFNTAIGR